MTSLDLAPACGRSDLLCRPVEIPDAFVRRFGTWCAEHGVKGKYSIVPYPACVGRLDRLLPGWRQGELNASLELVRTLMAPHWDIHPEMVTHTRVIDTKTGHPYPEVSLKFMENWDWTTGRSTDEIADYLAYALNILKNVGLPCEGITTPGGFGNRARPQLAQATLQAVRGVFGAEIPHYFRDLYDQGETSVAPRVEYASGLEGPDPRCVLSIVGCTGDWTGGWDCSTPAGVDRFITADLQGGRLVEVIQRGEPALMVCHWTGIYWNGQELGFRIFQEVVRRLHARFDHLTDSEYLRHGVTEWLKLWKANRGRTADRKPVKNDDLWRTLDELAGRHRVTWHWLKGHAGHPDNERCDQLARAEIAKIRGRFSSEQLTALHAQFEAARDPQRHQTRLF